MHSNARAQPVKNYEKEWGVVENHINKSLPQSALEEVNKIYTLARKDKQEAQLIKALIYRYILQQNTTEDNEITHLKAWEKEADSLKGNARSILLNATASGYYSYMQNKRWQIQKRTKVPGNTSTDIDTWTLDDFNIKITRLFTESLKNETQLAAQPLSQYEVLIQKGNVRHLKPNLYSLLADKALEYFASGEKYMTQPSYVFQLDDVAAFAPAEKFISYQFKTKDTASLFLKALRIYQKLMGIYQQASLTEPLLDIDIARLSFVNEHAVMNNKELLYENALLALYEKYRNTAYNAYPAYPLAHVYIEKGNQYTPFTNEQPQFELIKARNILEAVAGKKSDIYEAIQCKNLLRTITEPQIECTVEKGNIPNTPLKALIGYKNLNSVIVAVYKLENALPALADKWQENGENTITQLLTANKPVQQWDIVLKNLNDLQKHYTEIKIDPLAAGKYLLVITEAGTKPFNVKDKKTIAYSGFTVSNISYVNTNSGMIVVNRSTGAPLENAEIKLYQQKYNSTKNKYELENSYTVTTNTSGYAKVTPAKGNYLTTEVVAINYKAENYNTLNAYDYERGPTFYQNETENNRISEQIFLYTDRSIFRPGQTIYFKGIAISTQKKISSVITQKKFTVFFYDANGRKLDSLRVTTNDHGSFSGKFIVPQGIITGAFNIRIDKPYAYASLQVEEYKRPQFYVEFTPLKGAGKLNDTIITTGTAKAYAGNNISNAPVKYRVVRETRFMYPRMFYRGFFPQIPDQEIAFGETTTDEKGNFIVKFSAIPDLSVDKEKKPVFYYTVYADVTDLNGETRSSTQQVVLGYHHLQVSHTIRKSTQLNELKDTKIYTTNLNNSFLKAQVTVKIYTLQSPGRLIRARYWRRPDIHVLSKEDFYRSFPNDEYADEADMETWTTQELVFTHTENSTDKGAFNWKQLNLKPGYYKAEISVKDTEGESVTINEHFELQNEQKIPLKPEYLYASATPDAQPGNTVAATAGTFAGEAYLFYQTSADGAGSNNESFKIIRLKNNNDVEKYIVQETNKGGIYYNWLMIKDNRVFTQNAYTSVLFLDKQLTISYNSFRDKILPGSKEKWSLQVKGHNNEKIAAEMLVSMYDASLDAFSYHSWNVPALWHYDGYTGSFNRINSNQSFGQNNGSYITLNPDKYLTAEKNYDRILAMLDRMVYQLAGNVRRDRMIQYETAAPSMSMADGKSLNELAKTENKQVAPAPPSAPPNKEADTTLKWDMYPPLSASETSDKNMPRKNFNETAFFFPQLTTDEEGNISFEFTMPEALTKWKFQAMAHTPQLATGYSYKEVITQKDLMVQPNIPRFLREGDMIQLPAKIVNMGTADINGTVSLQLKDAATLNNVDEAYENNKKRQSFTIKSGETIVVYFPVKVPANGNGGITYTIIAATDSISDGEENYLPVLTNRILVTESLPMYANGNQTKNYSFDKLINSAGNNTLQHQSLIVEYTANPIWYAVQALPYLTEYPYECAEQTWNRYYGNSLAALVANSNPKIKALAEKWMNAKDAGSPVSNLLKNQELKQVILEETPWLMQGLNETEQMKQIGLLFDMVSMAQKMDKALGTLKDLQNTDGSFPWFKGGLENQYITQYIVSGIGHLMYLKALNTNQLSQLQPVYTNALEYLDSKMYKEYTDIVKRYKNKLPAYTGDYMVQYLYMRSFFNSITPLKAQHKTAYNFFLNNISKGWAQFNITSKSMAALILHRSGNKTLPVTILRSIKENSVINEESGRYFKVNRSWYWYDAPVERQALVIEAFTEINRDKTTIDELKKWLLKNKQTNRWESTKATAEACYALLMNSTEWLQAQPQVEIKLGSTTYSNNQSEDAAATGYFKQTIAGNNVTPEAGKIELKVTKAATNAPSWGAVYWQYFEDMDKITTSATGLSLNKKLFVEKNTAAGPVLEPVQNGVPLAVSNKIKVRIELKADREMEFVHMKDMRAATLEPVDVISGYRWQDGLGYYQSTKDAATHFFFDRINRGTYVFEYSLFVTAAGTFSNGITTLQCMYAPEFSSHSEGIKIEVK